MAYNDAVAWLLAHGASTTTVNCHGQSPLLVAAAFNRPHMVDMILTAGADLLAADIAHGSTALTVSAIKRDKETMQVLLRHAERAGITMELLNKRDAHGRVPEDHACSGAKICTEIVSMLRMARIVACVKSAVSDGIMMATCAPSTYANMATTVDNGVPLQKSEGVPLLQSEVDAVWECGKACWISPSPFDEYPAGVGVPCEL